MDAENLKRRIFSVDLLRGVVLMIMLLDHSRDFVRWAGLQFDPTDLSQTTIPLFFHPVDHALLCSDVRIPFRSEYLLAAACR